MQESLSEITRAELPLVVFNMARGQSDYYQATRGGGHGDYRHIVLAPIDVAEAVELTQLAFHLADRWRNPVLIYGDYLLAHTAEAVEIEPLRLRARCRRRTGPSTASLGGTGRSRNLNPLGMDEGREGHRPRALLEAARGEARRDRARASRAARPRRPTTPSSWSWPSARSARFARYVVRELRAEGARVGYFRPITLWPFPAEALARGRRAARAASPCSSRTPAR